AIAVIGEQRGAARDIATGLADRIDAAEHHVVDQIGIELVAALDRADRLGGEIEGGYLMQRAIRLAAATRGAHVIIDEGFGHGRPPVSGQGGWTTEYKWARSASVVRHLVIGSLRSAAS